MSLAMDKEDAFFGVMSPQRCKVFKAEENYAGTGPEIVPTDRVVEILKYDILDCYGTAPFFSDPNKLFVWIDPKAIIILERSQFVGEAGLLPKEENDNLKSVRKFPTQSNEYDTD